MGSAPVESGLGLAERGGGRRHPACKDGGDSWKQMVSELGIVRSLVVL
jgi:hypothetical protein